MNVAPSSPKTNWPDLSAPQCAMSPQAASSRCSTTGAGGRGSFHYGLAKATCRRPPFISEAAKASLDRGETFYTWQNGVPELREAIAHLHDAGLWRGPGRRRFLAANFFVTIGGMHAHRDRDPAHRRPG